MTECIAPVRYLPEYFSRKDLEKYGYEIDPSNVTETRDTLEQVATDMIGRRTKESVQESINNYLEAIQQENIEASTLLHETNKLLDNEDIRKDISPHLRGIADSIGRLISDEHDLHPYTKNIFEDLGRTIIDFGRDIGIMPCP